MYNAPSHSSTQWLVGNEFLTWFNALNWLYESDCELGSDMTGYCVSGLSLCCELWYMYMHDVIMIYVCMLRYAWIEMAGYWLTDIDMQDEMHCKFDNGILNIMMCMNSCITEYDDLIISYAWLMI